MEPDRSDCGLVLRLRTGDAGALEVVLKLHWNRLLEYVTVLGVDGDTAEDLAQQAFVRLWERREMLEPEGSLGGLLCRIARNLCFDLLRQRSARKRAETRSVETMEPMYTPHDRVVRGELRVIVEAAVKALPKRRREVFVLVRYFGLSHRETAKVLDLAPQTVANHLGMALADLRVSLARYLPDYYCASDAVCEYPQPHMAAGGVGS